MKVNLEEIYLKGSPISPGIAMGTLFFCRFTNDSIVERAIQTNEIEAELHRYRVAIIQARKKLESLKYLLQKGQSDENTLILEAHLQLLEDPVIIDDIESEIRKLKKNAEFVLQKTVRTYRKKFNAISDAFFRERFSDLQAIVRRILDCLKGEVKVSCNEIGGSIVYARELSVVDFIEVNIDRAQAFITEVNGATSHAAITIKAKGIPFITSIANDVIERLVTPETVVIVDGFTGDLFINPREETLLRYAPRAYSCENTEDMHRVKKKKMVLAETPIPYNAGNIRLSANAETAHEAKQLYADGVGSIGLFRSEYAFLSHADFPGEEEQFQNYKNVVEAMQGLPVVIRVFDLGGDKYLLGQKMSFESNPFLGCRGIRLLLRERELFKTQLKAIIRASAYGNLSILLPMISSLDELLETKELLKCSQDELESAQGAIFQKIRVGCMIEVPSAAVLADVLAKECDFFSIGTNDLVQYTLAIDRSNHISNDLYTPIHPSIIRLIKNIVEEADAVGIPVSVCGEMAANPEFTALLMGLGVHELSVSMIHIPSIRSAIAATNQLEACALANQALTVGSSAEVVALCIPKKDKAKSKVKAVVKAGT
ncbi:MAG: phosphoenolpyruvate--protein phosphotransferase [Parachlamydiaceae bacterium]|nr:phosphoenolpyruvate--protein phosphotransferase [Parachlamydiaceae bacterium]